LTDLHLSSSYQ